jgi:hypothetical protein
MSFFGQGNIRYNVGLNIYLMLLKNLQLSNYSLGYAKYRSILTTFQNEALTPIFVNTKQILIEYMKAIFQGNRNSIENGDLELALEVMNLILNYPFVICYLEFTSENGGDSTSITIFPEAWRSYFIDMEYFTGLVELLKVNIESESKLLVVKNLSKIASCKKSLIPIELEQKDVYIHYLLSLPAKIVESVNLEDSFYLEEIVELIERTINVFGLNKLIETQPKSEEWINAFLAVTRCVITKCYRLNEKVFNSVSSVWRMISIQTITPFYEKVIKEFLALYYTILFQNNNDKNVFSEVSYSQFERFKDMQEDRFKYFIVFYPKHKEIALQFLFHLSKQVFSDFETLAARLMQGSIHAKEFPVQLSKFLNFLLIISTAVFSEGCYSYSKPKTSNLIEGLKPEELEGMILGSSFKCISMLEGFNPYLDANFRRHVEVVVIYFFENLLKKVSRDVFFVAKDGEQVVNKLSCKHHLFQNCIMFQQLFQDFEQYLILTVNKCLGNLSIGDKIISRYSIFYLKLVVEELKRHLQLTDFNQVSIPTHISKELLNINNTNLTDPQFYKLRSDLYEIISICFLEELREDCIENIHTVLDRILELDLVNPGPSVL